MDPLIYFFPFIGALAGWMLHSLLIHKLVPESRHFIAKNTSRWVGGNLVQSLGLEQKMRDPSHFEKVAPMVEQHVDEFLRVKLAKQMPMISMFVGDKTIDKMKSVLMEELREIFPQVIGKFAGSLQEQISVEKLVKEKLAATDNNKWKMLVYEKLGPQLAKFRRMGALTGFIIGSLFLLLLLLFK